MVSFPFYNLRSRPPLTEPPGCAGTTASGPPSATSGRFAEGPAPSEPCPAFPPACPKSKLTDVKPWSASSRARMSICRRRRSSVSRPFGLDGDREARLLGRHRQLHPAEFLGGKRHLERAIEGKAGGLGDLARHRERPRVVEAGKWMAVNRRPAPRRRIAADRQAPRPLPGGSGPRPAYHLAASAIARKSAVTAIGTGAGRVGAGALPRNSGAVASPVRPVSPAFNRCRDSAAEGGAGILRDPERRHGAGGTHGGRAAGAGRKAAAVQP